VIRALLGEYGRLSVDVSAPFRVESGGVVLVRSTSAGSATMRADGRSLRVGLEPDGSVASAPDAVAIVPEGGGEVRVDGVGYGGRILVRVALSGKLQAINVLPLEEYLEGVVPHEIGDPGPDAYAAVEAQAITARTYALSRIEERQGEAFDVFAGVQDQVYRGHSRVSRSASAAVRDTRGVVLTYRGRLARTYYSATCGGHTSDIRRVWPQRESADYLLGAFDHAGTEAHSFCDWVRNFRWRYTFSGREMGDLLRRTLPAELHVAAGSVGSFVDLRVVERSPSGRVRKLEIETTGGTFTVEGDRIRWVLMLNADRGRILPSTLFDVERTVRAGRVVRVSIIGGGNGHGVGMCQNGAIGMARRGYSDQMILSHYYPGTTLDHRY
jgi:stage II sporulation protein D